MVEGEGVVVEFVFGVVVVGWGGGDCDVGVVWIGGGGYGGWG